MWWVGTSLAALKVALALGATAHFPRGGRQWGAAQHPRGHRPTSVRFTLCRDQRKEGHTPVSSHGCPTPPPQAQPLGAASIPPAPSRLHGQLHEWGGLAQAGLWPHMGCTSSSSQGRAPTEQRLCRGAAGQASLVVAWLECHGPGHPNPERTHLVERPFRRQQGV